MKETQLKKSQSGVLSSREAPMSVGALEKALLTAFPKEDACSWDYTGMFVGNPAEEVRGVAVALDPTIRAMKEAKARGANVLVTHHPVFLDPPNCFVPAAIQGQTPGAAVHFALSQSLNCMAFHTACDVSADALAMLPSLLRLNQTGVLQPRENSHDKGFGAWCAPMEDLDLAHLAARCVSVFGSFPRVWGSSNTRLESIVCCGGSAGSVLNDCVRKGVDCLVCGEVKYHDALNAAESGLCIVELGHDVSELPLCALLANEVMKAGVNQSCVTMVNQDKNWYTPETLRR